MTGNVRTKMCGLKTRADVEAATRAGAAYIGFVFFPKSPRYLTPEEAKALAAFVPAGLCKVALVVDAEDALLDDLVAQVPLDMLQCHGSESAARVAEIRARYGFPVMKAIGVAEAPDLAVIDHYAAVADQLLIDAKPPKTAILPGGNGLAFDWRLLAGRKYWPIPWMLAGGLTPDNVADAVRMTCARQVDVSTGIETAPGIKDAGKIHRFGAALADRSPVPVR